jgi:hypothetical protein
VLRSLALPLSTKALAFFHPYWYTPASVHSHSLISSSAATPVAAANASYGAQLHTLNARTLMFCA